MNYIVNNPLSGAALPRVRPRRVRPAPHPGRRQGRRGRGRGRGLPGAGGVHVARALLHRPDRARTQDLSPGKFNLGFSVQKK